MTRSSQWISVPPDEDLPKASPAVMLWYPALVALLTVPFWMMTMRIARNLHEINSELGPISPLPRGAISSAIMEMGAGAGMIPWLVPLFLIVGALVLALIHHSRGWSFLLILYVLLCPLLIWGSMFVLSLGL